MSRLCENVYVTLVSDPMCVIPVEGTPSTLLGIYVPQEKVILSVVVVLHIFPVIDDVV